MAFKKLRSKFKPRFKKGVLKGDLIARSRKALQLTKQEKKLVAKVKRIAKKKFPTKKKIIKVGKRIDFSRSFTIR